LGSNELWSDGCLYIKPEQDLEGRIIYKTINDNKTLLIIVPFLGWRQHDLNSHKLIRSFGERINELAKASLNIDFRETIQLSLTWLYFVE